MSICLAPSGARFSVTALSVADEDMMADRTIPDARKTNDMLRKHIHLEVGAGLYGGPDISKYLFGDRFWMTLIMRARSYDRDVYIDLTCKNPLCMKPINARMNIYRALMPFVPESLDHLEEVKKDGILLDNLGEDYSVWYPENWIMSHEHEDLVCVPEFECDPEDHTTWIDISPTISDDRPVYFKRLMVSDRNHILDAAIGDKDFRGRFKVVLPQSKSEVVFRMMSGADISRLTSIEKNDQSRTQSAMMLCRVLSIDGDERVNKDKLRKLSGRDASYLRDKMDHHDCGIDLWMELRCTSCSHVHNYDLPLTADFFTPESGKRKSGKRE